MTEPKLKQSPFLTLKARDFLRGALVAVLTAVVALVGQIIAQNGKVQQQDLTVMWQAAVAALVAYLTKNLFTKPDTPQQ